MAYYLYILQSEATGHSYVGCAEDVQARLARHNAGRVRATRVARPWRILHVEEFATYVEARRRERYYKTGAGRRSTATLFFCSAS